MSWNRDIYVYTVELNGAPRDIVALVPHDLAFEHGLAEEAIVGSLRHPADKGVPLRDVTPENFLEHRLFKDFLHKFLATEIYQSPAARKQAETQRSGHLYLIDRRTTDPQGKVPPEDILGAVEIRDGDLVPGTYQHNFNHQLLTSNGFFLLPEDLENSLIPTIIRLSAQRSHSPE